MSCLPMAPMKKQEKQKKKKNTVIRIHICRPNLVSRLDIRAGTPIHTGLSCIVCEYFYTFH